ncbi:hypothetical protein AALD22_05075 [Lachnospiraceae bacterium 56-18]
MEGSQEVYEINLIDLMFYCLKRWRWIVVCMVLMATVVGIYKYQATITDNQVKKEELLQQSRQFAAEQTEGEVGSEPIVLEDPVASAVSFAMIGMFGGVCFVCLIFCMRYVMSGKLHSESGFQEKFGMPLLGVVRKSERKKKVFGFIDRWIRRLEEGPYAKIPRKEQIKIAAVNVQAAIHKNPEKKIKRVMLAGTIAGDDVIEICEGLAEEIEEVTFSPYRQIVFHAATLKKLEYYEGILFIPESVNPKGENMLKIE